jgi:hypothetical protein
MILRDSTWIRADPLQVFNFFERMDRHYLRWHPDHLSFEWLSGRGVREGVVFGFEERIAGKRLRKKVVFTRVVPDRYMEFAPTSRPLRILLPRLLFRVEPEGEGVRLDAEIHIRTGPIGAWLNRKEFDAVREHMAEEGRNLKALLEGP